MIGVDIVKNDRLMKNLYNERFLKKILHPEEIKMLEVINSEDRRLTFIAGRFCGKEAFIKANSARIPFNKIAILNHESGAPYVVVDHESISTQTAEISISHEKEYSIAFVIIKESFTNESR